MAIRPDAPKHALDVHVDHALPLVHLNCGKRRERHDAGIVHQDVDASPSVDRGLRKGCHGVTVGHVQHLRQGGTSCVSNLRGNGLDTSQAACTQQYFPTGGAKLSSDALADAAGGASDQNDLVHGVLRPLSCTEKMDFDDCRGYPSLTELNG